MDDNNYIDIEEIMDDNNYKKYMNYIDIMDRLGIRQMILQGPPGTSKTHDAKKIVRAALGKLDDERLKKEKGNRWDIVQFHPSYCYEDFVRGITVSTKNENVVYETVNKIFGRMCKHAASDPDNRYFLIIDEINRADLAAVFGELIYALEYRGKSISIPYKDKEGDSTLTVPEKLYIIGTMNTADRSVGTIDYAVRRRFLFFDLLPSEDVLNDFYDNNEEAAKDIKDTAIECFKNVNTFIENCISHEYRAEDFKIGHTYFMIKNDNNDVVKHKKQLENRLRYQVLPILREYAIDGILQNKQDHIGINNEAVLQYIFNGKPLENIPPEISGASDTA